MAKKARPLHEKIAQALSAAKAAAEGGGVFRSHQITRLQLQTLKMGGWIAPIHTTWLALINPSMTKPGESTPYCANYWEFVAKYLCERLGSDYVLSPLASLAVLTFDSSIPRQLFVQTSKKVYSVIDLPFNTSIMISNIKEIDPSMVVVYQGLRLYSLEAALVEAAPNFYRQHSPCLEAALTALRDVPTLTLFLVERCAQTNAGRIAACLKKMGREKEANLIKTTMANSGFEAKSKDDVTTEFYRSKHQHRSVIGVKLAAMWSRYSDKIKNEFEMTRPQLMGDNDRFLGRPFFASCAEIDAAYESDAYNSLSIEGYGVTADLIARIAGGKSDLSDPLAGKEDRDALTARGYFEAFGLVKKTLEKLHAGADFGETVMGDLMEWKMALFAPSVKAGLLSASSMAGYRTSAVYIRDSLHVPPQKDKLVDAMKALGELIAQPLGPFSRAVLAHHMLVHIHPFSDGNGRTARFLMNVCLIAGGLPWTVIKTASRAQYFRALDAAHVDNDILPFAQFVYAQMSPKVV